MVTVDGGHPTGETEIPEGLVDLFAADIAAPRPCPTSSSAS